MLNTWLQKLGIPLVGLVLMFLAWRHFGWAGVAFTQLDPLLDGGEATANTGYGVPLTNDVEK